MAAERSKEANKHGATIPTIVAVILLALLGRCMSAQLEASRDLRLFYENMADKYADKKVKEEAAPIRANIDSLSHNVDSLQHRAHMLDSLIQAKRAHG